MIGQHVEHPQFGPGLVTAVYRNNSEWLVQFANGLRFRRPSHEFDNAKAAESTPAYAAPFQAPPMPQTQREARQLIESLRVGIAPAQHVPELTINLQQERESLISGLNQAHQQGGAVRAVVGEYGYGKSHMVELTTQEALNRNFLVAAISLDLLELPPHRPFAMYREALRHLRYPDTDERGLEPLLLQASSHPHILAQLQDLSPAERDPLVTGLQAITSTSSSRQRQAWVNWLMGGRRGKLMNKAMPRGVKFPSIYTIGHNARQIAFLFTAVSALARLNNYSGLCLLVDEAESYSLLRPYQRPKATLFFQAIIYAALRQGQDKISEDIFPQHRWCSYPMAYDQGQALFFLFTVTRSDNRLPLNEWLTPADIFNLEPDADPQEVGQFLQRILAYHAQAYNYQPGERQTQIRRGAAEHLAMGVRNGRLSMRSVVRLAVELFDLLYLHPDYPVATLLDELREQVR
ncbi:MAG: DUF2791 family P-loop domain-containing protein [Ardenticatenaceae bacterium]|nr:DUF2791 family P-loop domain-containing protein [Ardenticatenaceae bacterium]